ncbi:MAG: hypothetical protein Q8P40_05435 [Nitrospirota bacterium]|nr:hypothetical protein [Nitrospirota bacterium]
MTNNKKLFIYNLLTNYFAAGISILLGFIVPPIALSYWKAERYGIWTLITSIVIYLSASGLGVETAAGVLMAKTISFVDKGKIFRSSTFILCVSCTLSALIIFLIGILFPGWLSIFGRIPISLADEAQHAIIIFMLAFLINYPFSTVGAGFAGYQKQYIDNTFKSINSLISLASLLIIIKLKGNLIKYAFLQGVLTLIFNILKMIVFIIVTDQLHIFSKSKRIEPSRTINDAKPSFILQTGLRFFLFGLSTLIVGNIDNFVISNYIGVATVTPYSLTNKLFLMMVGIVTLLTGSSAPIISQEFGNQNWNWLKNTYDTLSSAAIFIGGGIFLGGQLFIDDFIVHLWAGPEGSAGELVILFLGLYCFIAVLVNATNIFLIQCNYSKGLVINGWAEAIAHIILVLILVPHFGIRGIAIGSFLAQLATQAWLAPRWLKLASHGVLIFNWRFFVRFLLVVIMPCFSIALFLRYIKISLFVRTSAGIVIIGIYLIISYYMLPRDVVRHLIAKLKIGNDRNH